MASVAAMIDTAKLLTDIAEQAKGSGMRIGYHNHAIEFKPVADRIPWEVVSQQRRARRDHAVGHPTIAWTAAAIRWPC